eukprot:gene20987-22986_t
MQRQQRRFEEAVLKRRAARPKPRCGTADNQGQQAQEQQEPVQQSLEDKLQQNPIPFDKVEPGMRITMVPEGCGPNELFTGVVLRKDIRTGGIRGGARVWMHWDNPDDAGRRA